MKLSQIRLLVEDFHKSVAFYRDVMELPMGFSSEDMQFTSFHTGETKIEIFSRQHIVDVLHENHLPAGVEAQSRFLLAFEAIGIDEMCDRLKAKGVALLNDPHDRKDWNARVAHLHDPDGNVIELYKHPL